MSRCAGGKPRASSCGCGAATQESAHDADTPQQTQDRRTPRGALGDGPHRLHKSVAAKIAGLVAVPIVFLAIVGAPGVRQVGSLQERSDALYSEAVEPGTVLKQLSDAYTVFVIDAVNKANAGIIPTEQALTEIQDVQVEIDELWTDYRALVDGTSVDESALAGVEDLFAAADTDIEALLAAAGTDPSAAFTTFDGPLSRSTRSPEPCPG